MSDEVYDDTWTELPPDRRSAFLLNVDLGQLGAELELSLAKNLQALTEVVCPLVRETAEKVMTLDLSDGITKPTNWFPRGSNSFPESVYANKLFTVEKVLIEFFLKAYAVSLACTPGNAIHGNLVGRAAGKVSALNRPRNVKRDFQAWARKQWRTRELPKKGWKSLLVKEYLKEMRSEGKVTEAVLKKYLTPSEGFVVD